MFRNAGGFGVPPLGGRVRGNQLARLPQYGQPDYNFSVVRGGVFREITESRSLSRL